MPRLIDSAAKEALAARIRFYRDLGLTEFYRRPVDASLMEQLNSEASAKPDAASVPASISISREKTPGNAADLSNFDTPGNSLDASSEPDYYQENEVIPPRKPFPAQPAIAAATSPADKAAALQVIREDIGDCTRCALHAGRHKIVFGDGSSNARLIFVGEGPGADEDAQGIPFVGRAGQLLNNMIIAMGLKREEVYIANVVKCRPPGNRTPEPEEAHTCDPFLFRQIDVVGPEVIVALGATAATYLLGQRQPLAGLRGRLHSFRGAKLIVTYHPAFLLRDPRQKKEAWADLQIAMRELGLKAPSRV